MFDQVRLVVEDMVEEGLMFPGQDTNILRFVYVFIFDFVFVFVLYHTSQRWDPCTNKLWQNLIFSFRTCGSFPTSFLSQIEADGVGEFPRQVGIQR